MNEISRLLDSLVLVGDRDLLIGEIEKVKRTVFSVGSHEELKNTLKETLTETRAREFFDYLSKNKKSLYDGHIIEEILESLRTKALEIDVVVVSVPLELSKDELVEMHNKITKIIGGRVVLKIVKEPRLLGGIKLEHNGRYMDLSLATTIRKLIP